MDTSSSTTPLLRRRRTTTDGKETGPKIVTGMKCPESYRGFSNLDEILSSFGNWHPLFRRNVALSTVIYLICLTSMNIVYTLRHVLSAPVIPKNSYCCCASDKHVLHQEVINKTLPKLMDIENYDWDEEMFNTSAKWGYIAGLALLFLCNIVGRRVTLGVSMVLLSLSISGVYFAAQKSFYQTRMLVFLANIVMTQIDLGLMMHMLEWLPSAARPLGVFCQFLCFYAADAFSIVIIRYSYGFAPHVLLVVASVTMLSGLLLILFRESPYYYLMKHDIDKLHDTLLYIAQYKGDKSTELEQDVDDAVDDVAFEVYEGNDTVVDAMIRMFKQRKLIITIVVLVVIVAFQKEVERTIDANELHHFTWGVFENPVRYSTFNVIGLILAFLITGRRRALPITLSFAVTGLLLVVAYSIQGDDTYDTCSESFVMYDVAGYFILVLRLAAEVAKRCSDVALTLYANEYFPSAVRPVCIAIAYLATTSFQTIIEAFSKAVANQSQALASLIPIAYCFGVSLASLLLYKEPFPMTAWYADLDRLDIKVSRENFPKPMLSRKAKKRIEVVDSD